ncbi:hypothetical protein AVEN_243289-1, partial [Araneus ventricosus]
LTSLHSVYYSKDVRAPRRSQSINIPPSSKRSPYIVSPGIPCRDMESSSTFKRISSPNGDIEKIIAPLRSHISSPKSTNLSPRWSPRSGVQTWLLPSSHTYPCKALFPTLRLALLGSDFPCL